MKIARELKSAKKKTEINLKTDLTSLTEYRYHCL